MMKHRKKLAGDILRDVAIYAGLLATMALIAFVILPALHP